MFIEHSRLYGVKGEVPDEEYTIPMGVSDVKRTGRDVTIITWSRMLQVSLSAAEELAKEGIECEIVDLRTLRLLDMKPVYASVQKTHRAIIVEEDWTTAGFGAEERDPKYRGTVHAVSVPYLVHIVKGRSWL